MDAFNRIAGEFPNGHFTTGETLLLDALLTRRGKVVRHEDVPFDPNTRRVLINRLRAKTADRFTIRSVWGVGYMIPVPTNYTPVRMVEV